MDIKQIIRDQQTTVKDSFQKFATDVNAYLAMVEKHAFLDDLSAVGQISQCHMTMVESVKQMQSAAYGPLNMIMLHFEEVSPTESTNEQVLMCFSAFDQAHSEPCLRWVSLIVYPLTVPRCQR